MHLLVYVGLGWYVDDLKILHVDAKVNEDVLNQLQRKFGQKVHEYLDMTDH